MRPVSVDPPSFEPLTGCGEVSISDKKKAASVDNRAGGPAECGRNPHSGSGRYPVRLSRSVRQRTFGHRVNQLPIDQSAMSESRQFPVSQSKPLAAHSSTCDSLSTVNAACV